MKTFFSRFLTLASLVFACSFTALATHVAGGDITVQHISGSDYEITLQLYGDCSGNTFLLDQNKTITIIPSCAIPNITANMILQNPGGTEVSQVCPTAVTRCTSATSTIPGLLRFEYKDTVSLTNLTCDYEFRFSEFARNGNVVNLQNAGSLLFYISTEQTLSVSGVNSTPVFAFNPIAYGIINQPLSLSFGATDVDGDSLKYSLVDAQNITGGITGTPNNINYESGYSATSPIQGVVLDQNTGALTALPTVQGLFTIVVKVEQFDGSGNLIGYVIRDIQVVIEPTTNQVPLAPASFTNFSGYADSTNQTTITAFPGMDFCADVVFTDANATDTLTLETNLATVLPGATLNITGQNPLTATVCWTATTGLPTNNTVIFNASDSACPVTGVASFSLNVVVPNCTTPFGVLRTENVSCANECDGRAYVKMFCGSGNYSYSWSGGTAIIGGQTTDTVTVCPSPTPYQLVVQDLTLGTSWNTTFNMLNPPQLIVTETIVQEDCDPNQCIGQISLTSIGGTGNITYAWNTGASGATLTGLCAGTYTVTATDDEGCDTSLTYEITEPVPVTAAIISSTNVLCNGDNTGQAVAEATLGGCGITTSGCTSGTEIDTIGNGTQTNTGNSFPAIYGGSQSSARHQLLFTAAELSAQGILAGPITSIAFFIETTSFITTYQNMQIKMGCTPSANLGAGWETGLVTVKNTFDHTTFNGWNEHIFDNAYVWDGTSNLVIDVCFSNGGGFNNGNAQTRFTPTAFLSVRYATTSNVSSPVCDDNVLIGSISGSRPNVRFGHCESQFTYTWAPAPAAGQTTDTVNNLTAGTYSVVISTQDGCTDTADVTITEPTALLASITEDSPITCNNPTGQLTASGAGGTPGYTYLWDGGQTSATISSLPAGTYTVTVTDNNGCTDVESYTLTAPSPVVASISQDAIIICQGDNTGQLTASGSGGSPGYTYLWDGGQTSATLLNLVAGTYTVTVTDVGGCTDVAQTTLVDPPNLQVATNILAQISCNGVCDGIAEAVIIGGVAPYNVSWSNGDVGTTASALCDGVVTVTVTDANGCVRTATATLVEPPLLTSSHTIDQAISCNGVCDGIVTVSGLGGTPPYLFSWPTGGVNAQESNLCAGTYDVTVTDANGCDVVETVTLTQPAAVTASITVDQQISCNGVSDGELTAVGGGGTPGYTYLWDGGQTSANISGLLAGTYTVTVTDQAGCTAVAQTTLTEPSAVVATATITSTIICNGGADGQIVASQTGGTPGYTYLWDGGQTNDTISNLLAGTYTVTVTDASGCTGTAQATLTDPPLLQVTTNILSQISCNGVCDGSAEVVVTGGVAPYTIGWSNGESGTTASALCDGTTTITITDANGCVINTSVTLTEPSAIVTSHTIDVAILCNATCIGEATVSATGGTGPYTYAWPGGGTNPQETGLCANTYDVTVTDANGCSAVETVTITEPSAVTASISIDQTVSCGGASDGELTASGGGGTPGYTYLWDGGQTSANISGLPAGTYTVTVTDVNGCTATAQASVTDPSAINPAITIVADIDCNGNASGILAASASGGTPGYTYLWDGGQTNDTISNLLAGTYTVTVTDASGCSGSVQATLTDPPLLQVTTNILSQISCNGVCDGSAEVVVTGGTPPYVIGWSNGESGTTASALCDGTTTITITDANGCVVNTSVTLTEPTVVTATHTIDATILCNGQCTGAATVTGAGGTPGYTYLWPGGGTNQQETGLCAGTYTVTVTDANGCDTTETIVITEPTAINLLLTIDNPISCNGVCDGEATAAVTGGTAPYNYNWSNGSVVDSIAGVCAGTYTVTITDANGCTVEDSVIFTEPAVLVVSATIDQQVSCSSIGCDGEASSTVTGGTAPYTYSWSNGDTTPNADSVCVGTLTLTVTDANGCTGTTSLNFVNNSGFIASAGAIVDETCFGALDGSATVVVSLPGTDYIYAWSPAPAAGQTTPTASGLGIGNYIVTVTDTVTSCTDTALLVVGGNSEIFPNASIVSQINCNAQCDGEINANATGGTGPYTYVWNGILNGASQSNLCAGQYALEVTDAVGCTANDTVTLIDPPAFVITDTVVNVLCNGACTGSISLGISGGTAPYNVTWDNGGAGTSISGLCAGPYVATITDANGCTQTASFTITEPSAIVPTISVDVPIACNGQCTGEISVSATGGTPTYSYLWSTGAVGNSLNGLCAGPYTVTVTDANGCTEVETINLTEPTPLVPSITVVSLISCNGECDGAIDAPATGGTPPYTYQWNSGQSIPNLTNLCAGTYEVTITDANGCDTMISQVLTEPTDIVTTPTVTNALCGICDGTITVGSTGGAGGYSYDWLNITPSPGNVNNVIGLCAGLYTVVTTDASGCTDTLAIPVNSIGGATGATFVATIPTCNSSCDGSLTVTPVGGVAPFSYQWSTGPNDTLATVNGLCGGLYFVTITDDNNCQFITSEPLITPLGPFNSIDSTLVSCNGFCDGSITITNTLGTAPFSYAWNDGLSGPTRLGLCAGVYTVTTTDGNGCTAIDTVSISQPDPITATITTSDASCSNTCDGSAIVVPSNGTPPYGYQWSNGESSDTPIALCVGLNAVTITDANGCTLEETVTIGGPPAIVVSNVTVTNSNCGQSDGEIAITVTGGAGGYTYQWTGGGATNPLTGISAGTYTVTITDANGCTGTETIPVSDNGGLTVNLSGLDASCNGVCDGEAYAVVPSIIGIPRYQWSSAPADTNDTVLGLCAGEYFITVTDLMTGCLTVDSITINEPPLLQFASFNTVNPNCGASDGEIDPVVVGGTGSYTYTINGTPQTIPFTGLAAGSYTIEVTDANNCTASTIVDLQDIGNINLSASVTDASCGNTCDGQVVITTPGPVSNYTFVWSNGGSTNDTLNNACAGNYTVTVTDINTGCTGVETVTVGAPPAIVITFDNVVNPNCGLADGSVEAVVTGGSGGYTYLWSDGQPTATASNLTVGVYTVTVTDASGCTNSAIIPLSNVGAITIDAMSTDASCDGSCTGTASVALPSTGGPYSIQWSTGVNDTNTTVSNVCPGIVSVTVTDASGCSSVDTTEIGIPDGIIANLTSTNNTPCDGNCTGSIATNVTSGTAPFTYTWSIAGETGSSVSGLCAGTYTVTISSSDGCQEVLTATIQDNSPLNLAVMSVNPASCPNSTDGSITIDVTGGETPYNYNWESNGFTSNQKDISNLLPGEYRLTVTDGSGCELRDTVLVDTINNVSVIVTDTLVCSGVNEVVLSSTVSTTASNVTYQWFEAGGIPLGTDSLQTVQISGVGDTSFYALNVVADGCLATDTSRVISVASASADAGLDTSIVAGERVIIGGNPTTDDDFATVQWFPGTTLDDSRTENPEASPRATVTYTVEVTNDAGCISSDQVTVTVDNRFEYPDGFSPNGDGVNDAWELDFLANYLDSKVTVFNRWGTIVYESDEGYPEPWDGTMDGEDLPIGTYYYIIDLGDEGVSEPLTGPISIMR